MKADPPHGFDAVDDGRLDNAGLAGGGERRPREVPSFIGHEIIEDALFHADQTPDAVLGRMFAEHAGGHGRLGEAGRSLVRVEPLSLIHM